MAEKQKRTRSAVPKNKDYKPKTRKESSPAGARKQRDYSTETPRAFDSDSHATDKPKSSFKRSTTPKTDVRTKKYQSKDSNDSRPKYDDRKKQYDKKTSKPDILDNNVGIKTAPVFAEKSDDEIIRLNRFISNAGVCARREADGLIASGIISVNGKVITEMGYKVKRADTVLMNGNPLVSQKKIYILLNKPKDCITTKQDPEGRRTVFDYIQGACSENVEPVGRLDRNTTGVLLFTNDGELAEKILHPRYNKMKIYHAFLDKNLKLDDFQAISEGVELEDGTVDIDDVQYVNSDDKSQIGIQIHSGKTHVVKRIFEKFGYTVEKLDRVYFAGLTKKNVPRGKWRFLTRAEVAILKQGSYE